MLRHDRKVVNPNSCSPIEFIHGARYHPELSNKTIAAEVRKLIREATKVGLLPKMKTSVTSSRYTIKVRILEATFAYKSDEHVEAEKLLKQFMLAYQKSEHWINGDYTKNNFSASVEWWAS